MVLSQLHRRMTVVGAAAALLAPFASASSAGATANPIPEQSIVVGLSSFAVHAESVLGGLPGSLPLSAIGNRYRLTVPAGEVSGVLAQLRARAGVAYAEVPQSVHADTTPNDPCYTGICGPSSPYPVSNPEPYGQPPGNVAATQGDLATVGAPGAWAVTTGSPAVTVAVLDTGVDVNHPDLAGVTVGPDVCAADNIGCAHGPGSNGDDNGHGTHVTGTIAASTDNSLGVASLGWNTHAEMIQVLDNTGAGNAADVATGIRDAVASGARVINMSLSNDSCNVNPSDCGPDADEEAAIQFAQANNVVVVAAAGNDASNLPTYPGSYPGVLSVAASDNGRVVQGFSQYGSAANIAAPGVDVLSTWNDGNYAVLSGTSMASPHVAAAAALVIAADPKLSGPQVAGLLTSSATPTAGGNPIRGGELDAAAAVGTAASVAATGTESKVGTGYDEVGANGGVYTFGSMPYLGSLAGTSLNRPIVGMAQTPGGLGYWLVAADGGIFAYGNARFFGSTGSIRLNQPIVGMASTPDGGGYWLVAADGGIFSYGDAGFYGSTGSLRLNRPIVGMAAGPNGGGYWLVAADGGIFAFGDAPFAGSTGGSVLNRPIVGMAAGPNGGGYWLVAADGGIFAFGGAAFYGSTGSLRLNRPITAMASTADGGGYWLTAGDGGLFSFGDAPYLGSTGGQFLPAPVVGLSR